MAFSVRWLGQGGFFLALGDKTLAIDPYLSDSVANTDGFRRLVPLPVEPGALRCDAVLCTHDHQDHLDPDTIANTDLPLYIGPSSCAAHFAALGVAPSKIRALNVSESMTLGEARVTALYARHTEDSIGALVEYQGLRLYFTGDTEYDGRLKAAGARGIDILFTCINGRLGNMNARDAARVAAALPCRLAVPMHYGMFAENTEDPAAFARALAPSGIPVFIMDFDRDYAVADLMARAQ